MFGMDFTDHFSITTKLTRHVAELVVGANAHGSFSVGKPPGFALSVTSIPLDGDANLNSFGHAVSLNASTNTITYSPSVPISDNPGEIPLYALPTRSRSLILVMAYIA